MISGPTPAAGRRPPRPESSGSTASHARPAHEVLSWSRRLVDPALQEAVATLPPAMRRIAGYHFGWWEADGSPAPAGGGSAGKAFRPALVLLTAQAAGGDVAAAVPAAAAVELVHNFSLVQDDVIDGDLTRRHRPTVWSVFGGGAAIVAGDALLTLAFDQLVGGGHPAAGQAARTLHTAAVTLMEGQHADLSFEDRTDVDLLECLRMAEGKSGAMLGCACALGALFGEATEAQVTLARSLGEQLGVAFQLTDDLLGIWGDPAVIGKPVHSDLRRRKKSLPLVAALTSGTRAGDELAHLYYRDSPMSDAELARAAELVELAGGRAWCRSRAADLLCDARRQLAAAFGTTRTAAELAALAQLAVDRDR